MQVLKTTQEEGVARLTISLADDDHRFEVWAEGDTAFVEYQESMTYRGTIETSEPDKAVYEELMLSEEMTEFLDEHDLDGVKRARTKA